MALNVSKPKAKTQRNSPIDGARGLFLLVLVLGHFGVTWLYGAWTMMSLFFLTSGYLITFVMLREHRKTGRVSVVGFYRRRARRLLPALVSLMFVVGTWAFFFASDESRRQMKGDILATLGFVMNWRLIKQSDAYFDLFDGTSYFRHAWSLAVEEQFYIVSPFIMLFLLALRTNRARLVILFAFALLSTYVAARVGVQTPESQARVYYGTDTRFNAILVGIGLAFVLRNGVHLSRRALAFLRWFSLLLPLSVIFTVGEMSELMFEKGGLLLFVIGTSFLVVVLVEPGDSWIKRIFSFAPLVWCGVRIYGIYLWHWPVRLWLTTAGPELSVLASILVGLPLTLLLAAISYRYLELPVIRHGLRGLPGVRTGRVLLGSSLISVLLLAFSLGKVPEPDPFDPSTVPPLVSGTPPYVPGSEKITVGIYGDSVSVGLVRDMPEGVYTDLVVDQLGDNGCDLVGWTPTLFNEGRVAELEPCPVGREELGKRVVERGIDTVVYLGAQFSSLPHWDTEGVLHAAMSPEHKAQMELALDDFLNQATKAGASFSIATVPCRDVTGVEMSDELRPRAQKYMTDHPDITADMNDPVDLNAFLVSWAEHNDVRVLDLYSAMGCQNGFQPTRGGHKVYLDEMHFSVPGAAMVWSWLAPEARRLVLESDAVPR